MRFDVVGDPGNPMVVMLPGSFCTGDTLRPIADRLSGSYCVVLVTLDGHVRGGGRLPLQGGCHGQGRRLAA